jgi:hypothetical protein
LKGDDVRQPLDLWNLLPAYHRREDAERGYPLRALLSLVGEQGDVVRHGIDALWDDFFIETCDRWVIPYLGELVANNPLHGGEDRRGPDPLADLFTDLLGPDLRPPPAVPLRTDVAKTLYYRRRKGTPAMLEELARDVTGWGAKVVEFFQLLEWTQNDDHPRLGTGARAFPGYAEVRRVEPIERTAGPFDSWAHTVDVRRIRGTEGWHGIEKVGIFLWRLRSYPLERAVPRPVGAAPGEWRFHLSPLGQPAPLFVNPRPFPGEGGPRITELDVPTPVRRALFFEDLRLAYRDAPPAVERTELYGPLGAEGSFQVWSDGNAVPALDGVTGRRVVCRRLHPWPPRPTGNVVALDPASGRMALGDGIDPAAEPPLEVSFGYGLGGDVGGGPYDRRAWLAASLPGTVEVTVSADPTLGVDHPTLIAALAAWTASADRDRWTITVLDSRTYDLPAALSLAAGGALTVQAADGQRPLLRASGGVWSIDSDEVAGDPEVGASLTLSGVVLEGRIELVGEVRRLRLLHATLVPGRALDPDTGEAVFAEPSLTAADDDGGVPINTRLRCELAFAICGGLRLPGHAEGLWAFDSILDGARVAGVTGVAFSGLGGLAAPGPPATLERVTIFGPSHFRALPLASEVIFDGPVRVERRQEGCVRFSWVPPRSSTPRRFRCQPDLALEEPGLSASEEALLRRRLVPRFTDRRYGQPGYAQLSAATAVEIRTGAEDGAEMGVYKHLRQPQRETNLRIRLDEYLPFGLAPGLIYVT